MHVQRFAFRVDRSACAHLSVSRAPEALTRWQWHNHLCSAVPSGKRVLLVNLDETAICAFQGDVKGNVLVARKTMAAAQRVSHGERRRFLTHVALLCDDPTVQKLLPRFLIGNEHTILAGGLGALRARCPPNVRLIRQRTAWVTTPLICQVVRALAAALAAHRGTVQVVLAFDACRAHVATPVFTACAAVNIWPLVVPARMTWLLQPLDTHVFALYKACLQKVFQETRVRQTHGRVALTDLLLCVYAATQQVLEGRPWSSAFASDGFTSGQTHVSNRVKEALALSGPLDPPSSRPTLDQLRSCFPANVRPPLALLWRAVDRAPAPSGSAAAVPALRRSPRLAAASAAAGAADRLAAGASAVGGAASAAAPSGAITRSRSRALALQPAGGA